MTAPATRAELARQDPARSRPANAYSVTFPRLVRSEWIKLRSLKSPWWSIVIVAALSLGISLLLAFAMTNIPEVSAGGSANALAVQAIVGPTSFTVLLAVILGSIQATGEYSTGMIRSTLTAAPGRLGVLLAKSLVVAAFVFVSTLAIFLLAALVTAPILGRAGIGLDLGDPGSSVLPILGASLVMAVIAVIGVSAGFILRSGPGAISLGVGLVFVLPIVPAFFAALPDTDWIRDIAEYLPTEAGNVLMTPGSDALPLPIAFLTLGIWVVVALAGAYAVLRTRDA